MLAMVGSNRPKIVEDEVVGAGKAGLRDPDHVPVRHEGSLEDGVLAGGRPHAERVPGLHDAVARRVARHDGVHDLRVIGSAVSIPWMLSQVQTGVSEPKCLCPKKR